MCCVIRVTIGNKDSHKQCTPLPQATEYHDEALEGMDFG